MLLKLGSGSCLRIVVENKHAVACKLPDGRVMETKIVEPDTIKYIEAKNMLLWLTEDQTSVYLCTVAADKKAELLTSLEAIKGESDVVKVCKASNEAETKFLVTSENTRIQLRVTLHSSA